LAPLIRLSYGRMVVMALPYTVVLAIVGLMGIMFFLEPATASFYDAGWIAPHTGYLTPVVSGGH
ncbi:sodium/proton antiporter, partial [Escherichia coli]|nr:sodium/proton antiporter [Escherichia coli]